MLLIGVAMLCALNLMCGSIILRVALTTTDRDANTALTVTIGWVSSFLSFLLCRVQ